MDRFSRILIAAALSVASVPALCGSEWNQSEYDVYPGDFNGDGRTDMLYVGKDDNSRSGIALADSSGQPVILHQDWSSVEWGIAWHSNAYRPVVADFTGDGKSDILMQRQTPGNHYLLITGSDGKIAGTWQEISNYLNGIDWSGSAHRLVAGKFNNDSKADLFFQSTTRDGTNAVLLADGNGRFLSGAHQSWGDLHLNVRWSVPSANVYTGDFNGDGLDDLLVQAKPAVTLIDYDVIIPVFTYRPGSFGIVYARTSGYIFSGTSNADMDVFWDRNYLGLDWSASKSNIVIGNFDGVPGTDILLQSLTSGTDNVLVLTSNSTWRPSTVQGIGNSSIRTASADTYRLASGSFGGGSAADLYMQGPSAGSTNYIALDPASSGSLAAHNPFTNNIPVAGTAVGVVGGEFSVDATGASRYNIPIDIPPGIAGMRPELALHYSSQGGNGLLGQGWTLGGLSTLTRCPMTWASDGFTDGVDFDDRDAFCLDGARLKATAGANGAVGAVYATEIETFQRVESVGGVAGHPDSFVVRAKSGTIRYYGSTSDSKVSLQGNTSRVYIWALKRIEDRYGNFVSYDYAYSSANSSSRPTHIRWGRGSNIVGRISFQYYDTRLDPSSGYFAGYLVGNTHLLRSIDVFSRSSAMSEASEASRPVASYYLGYETSPITNRSLVKEIVKCDGGESGVRKCMAATKFKWQYGNRGFTSSENTTATYGANENAKPLDINSDGRTDFIFTYGSDDKWGYSSGQLATGTHTGYNSYNEGKNLLILDWDSDGNQDLVQGSIDGGGNYVVIKGTASGGLGVQQTTSLPSKAISRNNLRSTTGDFDGDGRHDMAYAEGSLPVGTIPSWNLKVHFNQSGGFAAENSTNSKSVPIGGFPHYRLGQGCITCELANASSSMYTINFDGDGRDDILMRVGTGCTATGVRGIPSNYSCTGTTYRVFSFDVATNSLVQVWQLTVDSNNPDMRWMQVVDMNGDGLTDVSYYYEGAIRLRLGTGSAAQGLVAAGSFSGTYNYSDEHWQALVQPGVGTQPGSGSYSFSVWAVRNAVVLDYNRDGRNDIMLPFKPSGLINGYWIVIPGGPTGFGNQVMITGIVSVGSSPTDERSQMPMVVDLRGDGVPDFHALYNTLESPNDTYHFVVGRGPGATDVLARVTGGSGSVTDVQYLPLSAVNQSNVSQVYDGSTNFFDDYEPTSLPAFPYQSISMPMVVVSQIGQDNGLGSISAAGDASSYVYTKYKYAGLKLDRQGRGILGFSRVTSQNENTGIFTINEYGQRWPYTGTVIRSEQKFGDSKAVVATDPNLLLEYQAACETDPHCPSINPTYTVTVPGPKLTETVNQLSYLTWAGNIKMPYMRVSTETKYQLVDGNPGTPQPSALWQKVTEYLDSAGTTASNRFDDYGNPYYIKVTTSNGRGGDVHATTTSNTYYNRVTDSNGDGANDWCLGRMDSTTVSHQKLSSTSGNPGAQTVDRRSTFTYRAAPYCDLETETQDSTSTAASAQTGGNVSLTITSTHAYDSYGNKRQTTTAVNYPSGTPARTVTANFEPTQGQFARTMANALNQSETFDWDPRFGTKVATTGPNGITSTVELDTFGRTVRTTPVALVDGAGALAGINSTVKLYWCANSGLCADSRSVTAQRTTSSDGSQSWAEYDRLNRETVAAKLALNGSWLYEQTLYDVLGRPYAKSQPFFAPSGISNATRCWTVNVLDLLGRPVREESNYVEAGGGSSCGSSPPIAGQGLSGSIRKSRFEHDVVSGDWTVLRVYENEHDAEARRYSIKAVDSLGHTKFVAEELVSGACAQPGSAGCPQIEYDQDAQGNATFIRRAGQLAAGSAGFVSATFETKAYFDARGFKRWLQDPDLGEWRYDYNGYGELNWQRDSKGQVTTVTYDVAGRMRSRTEGSEGTSYFNFDETSIGGPRAVGKLTSVTQPGGFEERHSFDTYGRPTTTKRRIDGAWQWVDMTYDSQSRLNLTKYPAWTSNSTETSAAPDSQRLIVRNVYNGYGYHVETINQTNGQSVWTVNEINQYGITKETLGNGVVTDRVFEASTGRLKRITSQKSGVGIANDLEFAFNRLESVTRRADYVVNRSESFSYDALARLKSSSLYSNAAGTGSAITQNFEYDVFGNIVSKGGAGALFDQFDYRGASGCSTNVLDPCKPGAVRSVRVNGGATRTMLYDRNGNLYSQTGGAFTSVDWTVANLARRITKNASEYAEFSYAPDRGRFKQVAVKATGTETTIYVAGLYERYSKGSVTEHSYYIKGGAGVVAIFKQTYTSGSLTATATRYLHRDHLGSVVVMTSESGVAVDRMSFDSWGKRRDASTWSSSAPGVLVAGSAFTTRGYTGHEQVDFVALVHMNGRIYDAEVGRFLSADPYVAFPDSTQGFNRFSYVDNNPLSFTDPSGFSKLGEFLKMVGIAIVSMYVGQSFYYLAGEGVNGAIAGGFMGGFTSGFLSSGGNFDAGLMSGLCGAITAGIGHGIPAFDKAAAFSNQAIAKALVHGAVQGVFNDAMGGDFGSGFMGGFYGSFFGEGFTSEGGPFDDLGPLGQATVASIIGGTGALIGGGKFANGAASAAFVSLFNQAMVPKKPPPVYTVDSEYNLETKVLRATLYADGVEVETIKFEAYSGGGHEPETEIIIWGDAKPLAKGVWRITENPSPRKRYFALFMEDGNVNDEFLDTDGQWREAIRFGIHSSRGSHGCIMIWDQSNNNPQRHQSNWDKYQKWIRMTKPTKLTYTNSVLDQKGTAEIRAYGTITVK